jgi:hypothetical protein
VVPEPLHDVGGPALSGTAVVLRDTPLTITSADEVDVARSQSACDISFSARTRSSRMRPLATLRRLLSRVGLRDRTRRSEARHVAHVRDRQELHEILVLGPRYELPQDIRLSSRAAVS